MKMREHCREQKKEIPILINRLELYQGRKEGGNL